MAKDLNEVMRESAGEIRRDLDRNARDIAEGSKEARAGLEEEAAEAGRAAGVDPAVVKKLSQTWIARTSEAVGTSKSLQRRIDDATHLIDTTLQFIALMPADMDDGTSDVLRKVRSALHPE